MMQQATLYPWLTTAKNKLNRYVESDRLPSALLIVADEGLGALTLVRSFAKNLYCSANQKGEACDECATCQMFEAQSYPDYFQVSPKDDETVIKIDAIRKLTQSLALTSQYSAPRIAVIAPAESMSHQASNSLLKTLEEPSENTTIILLADKLTSLSATIRSRCQVITVTINEPNIAETWLTEQGCTQANQYLSLANGVPLVALKQWESGALEIHNDLFEQFVRLLEGKVSPLDFAHQCIQAKELPVSNWIATWLSDTVKVKQNADQDMLLNVDLYSRLKLLPKKLHLRQLYSLLDQLTHLVKLEAGQVNQQLLFEDFAINCHSSVS